MTEYRYTLIAVRPDGRIADLARFRVRELAELLLQALCERRSDCSFEIDDAYREKSLDEILNDDDAFETLFS